LQITIGFSKIRVHLLQTVKDKQKRWIIKRIFVSLQAKKEEAITLKNLKHQ